MKKKLFILLAVLVAFVPLGLLSSNPAWGEWDNSYYKEVLGFVPQGIEKSGGIEVALPDYAIAGQSETVSYYLSALLGIGLLFGIYFILLKVMKHEKSH
jgi:hypothetical protein